MTKPIPPAPPLSDAATWAFMAWEDWRRTVNLEPLWIEQNVYSKERKGYSMNTPGFKWTNKDALSWHDQKFGPYVVGKTLKVKDAPRNGEACGVGLHVGKTINDAIGYGLVCDVGGVLYTYSKP